MVIDNLIYGKLLDSLYPKSFLMTDEDGLQHEVIHYGDVKNAIEDFRIELKRRVGISKMENGDTISRQDAIDAVLGVIPHDEYWMEQVEKAIDNLPSAQPANGDLIQKIEEGIKATTPTDEYMVGMRNGMRWCKSLLDGKEPKYDIVQPNHNAEPGKMVDDAISRQAAIDALDCINGVEEVLRSLPSAQPNHNAEVSKMEIVCCENCEHWDTSWETVYGLHYCPMIDMATKKNFFCKYGAEKRGEA